MRPEAYAVFTEALRARLGSDSRVLGLVALGSMARRDYEPDLWSDHDFFVITSPGAQEAFRADRSWLPDPERVVFSYRETAHGVKALYDDGHLVEFAVFDPGEVAVARVNRYRVLLDRGDVERRLAELADSTAAVTEARADDEWLIGQFLTSLLVAAGRFARGERASARALVAGQAARPLFVLLARHVPSERRGVLDDLDPFRRFELAYPELGRELDVLLRLETPAAAVGLLDLARRELEGRMPGFPSRAAEIVRRRVAQP
jgi:hypothetical protein